VLLGLPTLAKGETFDHLDELAQLATHTR
jgi:hypothetical protein